MWPGPDTQPVVPPALWARLRALDRRCEMSFNRTSPVHTSPWHKKLPKVWVASIRPSAGFGFEWAQGSHPVFAEAVRMAVELAEQKGWHRPEVPPSTQPRSVA